MGVWLCQKWLPYKRSSSRRQSASKGQNGRIDGGVHPDAPPSMNHASPERKQSLQQPSTSSSSPPVVLSPKRRSPSTASCPPSTSSPQQLLLPPISEEQLTPETTTGSYLTAASGVPLSAQALPRRPSEAESIFWDVPVRKPSTLSNVTLLPPPQEASCCTRPSYTSYLTPSRPPLSRKTALRKISEAGR